MVRRRECRIRTVLPVRVFGMDSAGKPFTALAHTLDITLRGARLAGVQHSLTQGEIIGIQRGTDKARFRVAWVGTTNTRNPGQVGVECVQQNKNIWNVIFDESTPDTFDISSLDNKTPTRTIVTAPNPKERRLFARHTCDIGLDMQTEGSDVAIFARCTDISRGGCYIETRSPFPPATRLYLCLKTEQYRIRALAEVRSSHPSMGMGLRFIELGEDDQRCLIELLAELTARKSTDPASGLVARLQEGSQNLHHLEEEIALYDLHPATTQILRNALARSLSAIECCRRELLVLASPEMLRQALLADEVRMAIQQFEYLRSNLGDTSISGEQLRTLRTSSEALLERLSAISPAPPFDMPFIVNSTRPM